MSVYDDRIQPVYISYWSNEGNGDVVRVGSKECDDLIENIIKNPKIVKVVWRALFDIPVLEKIEAKPQGTLLDGLLIAQTVHRSEQRFGLKDFSKIYLDDRYDEEDQLRRFMVMNKIKEYGDVPYEHMYAYALKDAKNAFELTYLMLMRALDSLDDDFCNTIVLEHQLLPVVLDMCGEGINIDANRVKDLTLAAGIGISNLKAKILKKLKNPKLNLRSPKQLVATLWPDGNYPRYTKKGTPSTDGLSLLLDGRPVCRAIAKVRQAEKAVTTYLRPLGSLPINGRLHCNLNQSAAITGRFSSSGPNLQNQPRPGTSTLGRIRECYVAPKGFTLVSGDFDQIEIRLLAHESNDPDMINAILNGEDIHHNTCVKLFHLDKGDEGYDEYRYIAKQSNFMAIYGVGATKFVNHILEMTEGKIRLTVSQGRNILDVWWAEHPYAANLKNDLLSEAAIKGGITTYGGRFIPVEDAKDHAILNYKIQGSAAVVMKKALIRVARFLKDKKSRMLLTVHDEILFKIHNSEIEIVSDLKNLMEDTKTFRVPLTVSMKQGQTWGTMQKLTV